MFECLLILAIRSDPMIAAAFESLQPKDADLPPVKNDKSKLDEIDERIIKANTVGSLLSVADSSSGMTRKHALKVSQSRFGCRNSKR